MTYSFNTLGGNEPEESINVTYMLGNIVLSMIQQVIAGIVKLAYSKKTMKRPFTKAWPVCWKNLKVHSLSIAA